MFTGLIAEVGSVTALEPGDAGATLKIQASLAVELREGDSIAVNGVCLTVTGVGEQSFQAQAMHETLQRSSLGALQAGSPVNLELPLRAEDRLGGHVVQGHVDGTVTVSEIREEGFARVLTIEVDPALARFLVEKGSVSLDGVSLTVSVLHEHAFAVALIPETLERTNLGQVARGDQLNLEVDILAKHVDRLMQARA